MTSSAKKPVARKTRTRKPKAAAAVRQTVELSGGVKVTLPEANKTPLKKVTRRAAAPKRPSTAKLISFSRYVQDAKQRWAIHEFEINALASDLVKGFNIVQPQVQRLANQFKN